jgi:hypothetical protein
LSRINKFKYFNIDDEKGNEEYLFSIGLAIEIKKY